MTGPLEPGPRERLLRTADELFYSAGIGATGVDALIDRAGVAKATFYRHFTSKDDLVLSWLRGADARWLDWLAAELDRRFDDPLRRLVEWWGVLDEWMGPRGFRGCPFLNTLTEVTDPTAPARVEVRSYFAEVEAWFATSAGEAGLGEPEELGRRLRLVAMAMFMTQALESSRDASATARAIAVDLLAIWLRTTPEGVEDRIASAPSV